MIVGLIKKERPCVRLPDVRSGSCTIACYASSRMDFWLAWQPGEQSWLLKAAFWVTETAPSPGASLHI